MSWILVPAPLLLLSLALLTDDFANRWNRLLRASLPKLVLTSGAAVLCASVALFRSERIVGIGIYFDGLAATMSLLICFVGWVASQFSIRYLDGDPCQGRFTRWMGFTLGAVLSMVIASNLSLFVMAWIATSYGLHQLLTHYSDRPDAILAARKKFLISRLGDLFLIAAMVLTYLAFDTLEFARIFTTLASTGSDPVSAYLPWIGLCLVVGAMTKSAQFPLHSWLPDTMETPTPVSALMHAGIINAGGYLIIRLSPIIAYSPLALHLLASIGAMTALFGAAVMLTQTSIKRSLAYSTIAQMGFMMLQCGLGAFAVALLHIVAHSLYKAYAFLSTGSVLKTRLSLQRGNGSATTLLYSLLTLAIAASVAWVLTSAVPQQMGVWNENKPGAILLGIVLTFAATELLWRSLATRKATIIASGIAAVCFITTVYLAGGALASEILDSTPTAKLSRSSFETGLAVLVFGSFTLLLLLQASLPKWSSSRILRAAYVHISNGLYLDITAHRVVERVWRQRVLSDPSS